MNLSYATNLFRLLRGDRVLRPLTVTYYVTTRCNFGCAYCEDFGVQRNAQAEPGLPLDEALQVLRVIRSGTDALILTGGEPLLYPEIDELAARARRDLRFAHITLLTNASLLGEHPDLPPLLDRLVVSLDSVDAGTWSRTLNVTRDVAERVLANLRAARQARRGPVVIVNCVLTPETLAGVDAVLAFCREHGLLASFSPQAVRNWPRYELLVSAEYRALLERLMALKRRGAPIAGSLDYLRVLRDLASYDCYPALIPRVMPGGELIYPCRPIEKDGGTHGGRPCNLREVASWDAAVTVAAREYGPPPRVCTSCFQQCFAEPSLMQAKPLAMLGEWLRYPASRRAGLTTYAPG